jgi:carboxylesterase type B
MLTLNNKLLICLVVSVLVNCSLQCDPSNPDASPTLIETKYGKLQGTCNVVPIADPDTPNRAENVISWLGVPFAQPPIGSLRFMPPAEVICWTGVRNATSFSPACMQEGTQSMSEDCLYLNIYAPFNKSDEPLPIFIHVHGGTFVGGSGQGYAGSYPAGIANIIVVTVNYRLGPFGFMYLGQAGINGNMAFLDQHMALKWVHENACSFNGDRNRITFGGHSAGSFSVGYHLIYSPGWKYIRNMFFSSGAIFASKMNYMPLDEASRRSSDVFSLLGCSDSLNSSQRLQCIQDSQIVKSSDVINTSIDYWQKNILLGNTLAYYLNPMYHFVQNGIEFTESVKESFERGHFKKDVKLINGYTHDEGGYFIHDDYFGPQPYNFTLNSTQFTHFIDKTYYYFPTFPSVSTEGLRNSILVQSVDENKSLLERLVKVLSENIYICPSVDFTTFYSQFSNTYRFSFDYRWILTSRPPVFGVEHGKDQPMWSGAALSPSITCLDDERRFSLQLIKYWTNFVKYDDPNLNDPNDQQPNPTWPPYSRGSNTYMSLDLNNIKTTNDSSYLGCDFWREYYIYPDTTNSARSIFKENLSIMIAFFFSICLFVY